MEHKLNNTVIKVLNQEHGAKVIQWFKEQGVYTSDCTGSLSGYYYGLFKGDFTMFTYTQAVSHNLNIIELPEELPEELPKDWYIKVTEENIEILNKWRLSVAADYKNRNLRLGTYVLSKHHSDFSFFYDDVNIKERTYSHYKEIDLPTFLKITNMKEEKPEEENRIITASQAQEIINVACTTWKKNLAFRWGSFIVLNEDIEIKEDFYKTMRKACTPEQHKLFDRIFGKDVEPIPYGTPCLVRDNPARLYKLVYADGKGRHIAEDVEFNSNNWKEVIPLTSLDDIPKLN